MYLIKFTVRKTITWYGGLGASCPTTFHKIAIRIFNWNCKRLLTALSKPHNSWALGDWGWVDFAAIRSSRETYFGRYRPLWVSISHKIGNPTATLVSVDKARRVCFLNTLRLLKVNLIWEDRQHHMNEPEHVKVFNASQRTYQKVNWNGRKE